MTMTEFEALTYRRKDWFIKRLLAQQAKDNEEIEKLRNSK